MNSHPLNAYKVTKNDYIIGDLINKGPYGGIYEGVWKETISVAVKEIFIREWAPMHYNELYPCFHIKHPNILPIYAIDNSGQNHFLLMEKMETSLARKFEVLVSQSVAFDLDQIEHIAESVANALFHLHKKKLVHGNIKPNNILFNNNNEIKVSDFGLHTIKNSADSKGEAAKIRWRPPESFRRNHTKEAAMDVYSFGMILWQLFAMKIPYDGMSEESEVIRLLNRPYPIQEEIPKNCPPVWANLIQKCWNLDPKQRPTMKQVKEGIKNIKRARKSPDILRDTLPQIKDFIPSIQNYIEGFCITHPFGITINDKLS